MASIYSLLLQAGKVDASGFAVAGKQILAL